MRLGQRLLVCMVLVSSWAHAEELTIYSGRSEKLVGPILKQFEEETGVKLNIRYGKTPQLAAAIIEEGRRSPADIFYAQDGGALGALAEESLLTAISDNLIGQVDVRFVSPTGSWIGITGRARTVDYNTEAVNLDELPNSIWGFLDKRWSQGRIGWAPLNSSFQSFVAALLVTQGEERTRLWLRGILANQPQVYPKNTPIVAALGRGEIEVGFVNNYYLHRFLAKNPNFPVAHHYTKGDAGSMINIAGMGILRSSNKTELAEKLIQYLLSAKAQTYFAENTFEYPLVKGVNVQGPQKTLQDVPAPDLDLSNLKRIREAVRILKDERVL